MLSAIISWCLRHRLAVIVAWLGVAGAGVLGLARLPIDAFPDTTPVMVQVNTVAPALAPLEIERQITARVEQALAGLPELTELRSISKFGLSQVTLTFADGAELMRARQVVAERLNQIEVPPGVRPPTLGPMATGLGEVFHYLVESDRHGLAELRTIQDWTIKPQLASVRGVAEINTWGGDERQIQIVVDPQALDARGLGLADIALAVERNNHNVGGGTLDRNGEATVVQGVGLITSPRALAAVVIRAVGGTPIRIGDVAEVIEGRAIRRGAVTTGGTGEVVLGLGFMLVGENSHAVTARLAARLIDIQKTLPAGVRVRAVHERTTLVDRVLATVRTNLIEGALLVVAVLFVFLGSVRAGLIVAAAIPLSMLFAFDLMTRAGIAGSLMSLGAIDFGLVVDSSVIMVENAVTRLAAGDDRPRAEVVRDAALEVRRPTLFGELIIMIVYLPVLALEGVEGKLFRPMALTVIFALLGSMLLSLTLMPVLASLALPRRARRGDGVLMAGLKRGYRAALAVAMRARWLVLTVALVVVVNAGLLATRLGTEFVPRLREETIVINTIRLASVSLDESVRYGTQIERALLAAFPDEIERVWTRTGTAEVATDPMGIELSDVFVTLTPRGRWTRAASQDQLVVEMEALVATLPGMRASFTQPIEMRVNEMIAGVRTDVGVKLFGDDLDVLRAKAAEVERIVKTTPGAADVVTEQITGVPTLQIVVDSDATARHGIATADVLAVVAALGTAEIGTMQDGERRVPIALRLADRYRVDDAAVGRILVRTASGDRVPLARLARIEPGTGPATIQREWGRRRVIVQANVRGRDLGSFVAEARRRIAAEVDLPPGYYVRFGGQFEHLAAARARLMIVVPIALVLIFVLLYVTYGRASDAVRVFTGVPFAAVGGVVALWLRDLPLSVSAGIGFVALSGVAVLGDMVLVSTFRGLVATGLTTEQAVREAAVRRLRPVLMTALVAGLGFVPMALNTGIGAEVQRPLATVVLGGMVSSTLLTLFVLPVLYALVGRPRPAPAP